VPRAGDCALAAPINTALARSPPGTQRHIQNALKTGATPHEIFAVLQICVAQGVQACHPGLPILAEELALREANGRP